MPSYKPLLQLRLMSDYYRNGHVDEASISLTDHSTLQAKRLGLVCKASPGGVLLLYDYDKIPEAKGRTPLRLIFKLHLASDVLAHICEPSVVCKSGILSFVATVQDKQSSQEVIDLICINDTKGKTQGDLSAALSHTEKMHHPDALLALDLAPETELAKKDYSAKHYAVNFQAKKVFWQYMLSASAFEVDVYVSTKSSSKHPAQAFHRLADEIDPSGNTRYVFLSPESIAYQQYPSAHFQLKSAQGDVLIKQLPAPNIKQLTKRLIEDGKTLEVAQIFINY